MRRVKRIAATVVWSLAMAVCGAICWQSFFYAIEHPNHPFGWVIGSVCMASAAATLACLGMALGYIFMPSTMEG